MVFKWFYIISSNVKYENEKFRWWCNCVQPNHFVKSLKTTRKPLRTTLSYTEGPVSIPLILGLLLCLLFPCTRLITVIIGNCDTIAQWLECQSKWHVKTWRRRSMTAIALLFSRCAAFETASFSRFVLSGVVPEPISDNTEPTRANEQGRIFFKLVC